MCTSVHVCAHACVGVRGQVSNPCARVHLTWGRSWGAACALKSHSPLLLELREFSFKPATLMLGQAPPPRVQQEAMTSAASLPEQSPGGGCCSLTGAEARTSAAGPWRRCSRGDGSHPRTCQPAGEEGVKSKPRRSGLGRCWGCRRGVTRICPLCPGAPAYINSTVSSQTCTRSHTPPRPLRRPHPHPAFTSRRAGSAGREAGGGKQRVEIDDDFFFLPIHRFG